MKKKLLGFVFVVITISSCSGDDSNPAVNSGTDPDTNPNPTYTLGATGPGGGIIFFLDEDGRGYEVGKSLGKAKWEDVDNPNNIRDISGLGSDIGTGQANTSLIISTIGNGNYAAKLCTNYEHGGKSDWFLPSKEELITLYNYSRNCGCVLLEPANNYWSSSQGESYTTAWNTDFSVNSATTEFNNWTFEVQKSHTLYVVPIRKFNTSK